MRARDSRHGVQARGKQATWYENSGCHYTRTTGIWQTVWLEAVPPVHIRRLRITPNLGAGALTVAAPVTANRPGHRLRGPRCPTRPARWPPPRCAADLDLTPTAHAGAARPTGSGRGRRPTRTCTTCSVALLDADGAEVDAVRRATPGLRSVAIDGHRLLLNGQPRVPAAGARPGLLAGQR